VFGFSFPFLAHYRSGSVHFVLSYNIPLLLLRRNTIARLDKAGSNTINARRAHKIPLIVLHPCLWPLLTFFPFLGFSLLFLQVLGDLEGVELLSIDLSLSISPSHAQDTSGWIPQDL
jgi:hypothetical protein